MPKQSDIAPTDSIALRAFAVLEVVVAAPGAVSLDEVTQAVALPKPTTFRILNMLQSADLLRRDPASKRYTVGARLGRMAADLWRNAALRAQWHRALEEAVKEIGESCNLTLLENDAVLYVDRVETHHPLRLHLEIGTRVPLHCTASGKLFLSRMSPDEARRVLGEEPFERFTGRTITGYRELEQELAKVRRTGVGTHDSELFDDSVAIAVPVSDSKGIIYAAVAVHAPSSRATVKSCMQFLPALRRAAAVIGETMSPPAAAGAPANQPVQAPGNRGEPKSKLAPPLPKPTAPPNSKRRTGDARSTPPR